MFSEALHIMDRNTTRYMIDEMQQTISEQGQTISEQGQTISEQGQTISEQGQTISEQGQTIFEQGQTIKDLQKDLQQTHNDDINKLADHFITQTPSLSPERAREMAEAVLK